MVIILNFLIRDRDHGYWPRIRKFNHNYKIKYLLKNKSNSHIFKFYCRDKLDGVNFIIMHN